MTRPSRSFVFQLSPVAALMLGTAPMAAQAQVMDLDEITVSANLTPTEISRSGSAVSVVTREDLEKQGDVMLVDFLARLPGVTMTRNGGPGTSTSVRIRGAGPEYVAVYVDGVRIDDPASLQVQSDLGHFSTGDISRIEVLRGSQSALYGGSAVGGVINITTLGAETDGFSQSAAVEAGSFDTFSGRYGLAYRDDRFEASLNVSRTQTNGFSAHEPFPGAPGLEDDGFDSNRLSFSARYQVSDDLALGLSAFAQDSENEYDDFGADADNLQKREERGGRLFAEYAVGRTVHEFSVESYDLERRFFAPRGTPAGTFEGKRLALRYTGTTEIADNATVIYGADTTEEEATIRGTGPNDTRISGAFVQGLWAPTRDLDLSASVRVDENSNFGNFWSGRFAAAWQVADGLTLRGAIARGFRAPSLNEQLGNPVFSIAPNPGIEPEDSLSYELGAQYEFATGATIGANLFRLDIDNAITYCQLPGGFFGPPCPAPGPAGFTNQYQNIAGTSQRQGIEVNASIDLTDRHDLTGVYTYTDARDPSGTRLGRVPFHDLSLSVGSQWTDTLRSNVSLTHVAGRTMAACPATRWPMPA